MRVGVVGAGFMGQVHCAAARANGARVVAIASSTPERAQDAARRLGADVGCADWRELVELDLDVVHVCTPNHLHRTVTEAALRAGKSVICEKPLATDVEGAHAIHAAALDAAKLVSVPFVYRYYPTVRHARLLVEQRTTGPLWLLHGGYAQDWLLAQAAANWRVDPQLGGASRAFADIGSHWCDLVEFVSGHRIARLSAKSHIVRPQRGGAAGTPPVRTEDLVALMFETDAGAIGTAVVSQVSPGRKNRLWFEISGSEAGLAFDQEQPETIDVWRTGGVTRIPRDPLLLGEDAKRLATLPGGHPQGYNDCFGAFVGDTYAAVAGGTPDGLPTSSDGVRSAEIVDAVLRSSADGASWVDVADAGTRGRPA